MADEPLGKEFVEFEATGLDELLGDVNKLEEAVKKSYSAMLQQKDALADPAWRQHSEDLHRIKTATDDATKSEKARVEQVERARRLVSGEFIAGKRRENTGRLADAHYQIRARSDLLASGEHLRARRIASDSTAAAAAMTLRERSAALKSGQFGRESTQANALTLQAGQQDVAEGSMLLKSGAYLENRENDGRLVAANGVLGLRERKTALAGGTFGRESHRANLIEEGGGRLANRERASQLASGEYARSAAAKQMIDQEREALHLAERRAKLASGLFVGGAAGDQRLAKERELLRLAERRAKLSSGLFAADVQQRAFLGEQSRLMDHQERRAELRALHGRLGGSIAFGLERARPAMLAAAGVGAVGIGMAKSGFSGTVEGTRLSTELTLLNREIASALLPAMRDLTSVMRFVRQTLGGLTGDQQGYLGYGIMGAVGIGGLGLAANGVGSAFGGLSKIAGLFRGGSAAAAAGGAAVAGPSAAAMIGPQIAATALATPAAATTTAAGSRLARFGRAAGPIGIAAAVAGGLANMEPHDKSFYRLSREAGHGKLRALSNSFTGSIGEFFGGGDIAESFGLEGTKALRAKMARRKIRDMPGHESVTPNGAGFEDFDETYKRVAVAVADRSAATPPRPPGTLAPGDDFGLRDLPVKLQMMIEVLKMLIPPNPLR